MKLRFCYVEVDERLGNREPPTLLSVSQFLGVVPRSTLTDDEPRADSFVKYKLCRPGDLVLNRFNAYRGSLGAAAEHGMVSPDYLVLRPATGWSTRFLDYLLRSDLLANMMKRGMGGIGGSDPDSSGFARIDVRDLGRYELPFVPSPDEQRSIGVFLDHETAKIDSLIAKQEQLIATLREDRTATITHAVTNGLNLGVPMKDSGIQTLGSIPADWSVTPFLRCVQGRVDYRGATPKKVDDGVVLITARNVRTGWIDYEVSEEYVSAGEYDEIMRRGLPEINDLLFTMEAPLGNAALVDRTDIALAQRIIKFRPARDLVLPKFLLYSVMSEWFQSQLVERATGSTALGLKASKLPELRVIVPNLEEQSLIVVFLDERCEKIDHLIAKASQVIDMLREYRSALITDAVTGKIDVRGAA